MRLFLNPLWGLVAKLKHTLGIHSKSIEAYSLLNIIPLPQKIRGSGDRRLLPNCYVYSDWAEASLSLVRAAPYLGKLSGGDWRKTTKKENAAICIELDTRVPPEGYTLDTLDHKILIRASTAVGVLYGLYSLVGTLESSDGALYVPSTISISDYPSNNWRGIHIDVARNFFDISVLYELVDLFSFYKLNKFHLHLTDDQGWRFESKKYPLLHERGGTRKETAVGKHFPFFGGSYLGDKKTITGYYTQSELRELDLYALERGVEIVPEIDIPGHATAALVAYPEYAAHRAPHEVATYWGIFNNVFSPSDSSIKFLCDIFDELADVFSSKYIHIGGDEVPAKNYKKDFQTKALVERGIIESFDRVDTYILDKVAQHIRSIGKTPVLWDEGREIALKHSGVTMIWRDSNYAKEVLDKGGSVVLCPTSHFYFDYYQKNPDTEPLAIGGYLPLEQVYTYAPPSPGNGSVLGMQANLWTEYIQTPEHLMYMLQPRLYALSEVSWGTSRSTRIPDFLKRVLKQK